MRARTAALERSAGRLKLSREEIVRRLSRAVEYRDEETGGHTERMSAYSALLAGKLGLDVESIRIASPMHDVGKVALPDSLLLRPGALDAGGARGDGAAHLDRLSDPGGLRQRAARARRHDRADPPREVGRHRLPPAAGRAARSRWRDRSRRSRTCSTRSPATGPTARRSRSRRPCRSCGRSAASTSTRGSSTCSSRTSTSCWRSGTGTRRR